MDACYQHPDRPSVEQCEACGRPVCGSCLWYADSGERLCPEHGEAYQAAGQSVHPPGRYAAGIAPSEASALRPPAHDVPYRGNSTDLGALIAAVAGVLGLLSCAGLSWLVPAVAFFVGLVIWLQSKDALEPRRTRWLAGLGMASGGVVALVIIGFFGLIFLCMFVSMAATSLSGFRGVPTPTPSPFGFPTP